MLDQSINKHSIEYIINDYEKNYKFKSDFINGVDNVINQLISDYKSNKEFDTLIEFSIKKKKAYQVNDLYSYYFLKRFNLTFRTINSLKQANRNEIVSSIVALIKDKRPYSIIRLDIKDFYESIDRSEILANVKKDIAYSKTTTDILEKWLDCFERSGVSGLPRGLNISASLSEYYLRDFDKQVKQIKGVFYYARFVDDIIIFTTEKPEITLREVESYLPSSLTFHDKNQKRNIIKIIKDGGEQIEHFNYLGYEFRIEKSKKGVKSTVDFSEGKIKKIKTKIIKSFLDYKINSDFQLLRDRICFLTHNYYIYNKYRDTKIKSGIYYNYPSISHPTDCRLSSLDGFLDSILFNTSSSKRILGHTHTLTSHQKRVLVRMRFHNGYNNKLFYKFSYKKIIQIKACWSY